MTCIYCQGLHTEQVYRLERKDGSLIGYANYHCLNGTFHREWWRRAGNELVLVPSRMPWRCVLVC